MENLIILAAMAYLTQCYAFRLCSFYKILEDNVVFKTIDILSPNIYAGPSNATPND
jgi:hypothetical protein